MDPDNSTAVCLFVFYGHKLKFIISYFFLFYHIVINDILEESQSNWSSPCILVPKHNGGFRFCTDFRKVNDKTNSDSFPIPRIADCIDQIGNAKFVSTFDMLKGYWQVPLT